MINNQPPNAGNAGDVSLIPRLGRSPGEINGNCPPVFLPMKFHVQRSPVGHSPWGHKRVGHGLVQQLYTQPQRKIPKPCSPSPLQTAELN